MRLQLLEWSEFIKINKFNKILNIPNSSVSNFLKYNTRNISDEKVKELYQFIKDYLRNIA